jgi:hypothetical protein
MSRKSAKSRDVDARLPCEGEAKAESPPRRRLGGLWKPQFSYGESERAGAEVRLAAARGGSAVEGPKRVGKLASWEERRLGALLLRMARGEGSCRE